MSGARQLTVFFVAVFAWTWGLAAILLLAPRLFGVSESALGPFFFLAVYGPSLASIVLTGLWEGRPGLRALFARLDPRRARLRWYLVVVVGMIALSWLSGLVAAVLGLGEMPRMDSLTETLRVLGVALLAVPGPLGEELGWRGFALPRMLDSWSPFRASLVLGAIWGIWHLPAFFLSDSPQQAFSLPLFLAGAMGLSVMVTWLFARAGGSVLISILFHLMANHANDVTGVGFEAYAVGTVVLGVVLLAVGGMRRPAPAAARHGA